RAVHQMQVVFETNLEILDSSPAFVAGREGHQFIFIGKGPDVRLQYMCLWTLAGTTAWQITYTAMAADYAKHLGEAKRIMSSFRIQQ
ncbi:MAG: hypothetical protein HZA29_04905, partial [Candidatus Omnitrophica bacterium]|nr:hypothetical protein [Candidatus Omnitrophota bacterium]